MFFSTLNVKLRLLGVNVNPPFKQLICPHPSFPNYDEMIPRATAYQRFAIVLATVSMLIIYVDTTELSKANELT